MKVFCLTIILLGLTNCAPSQQVAPSASEPSKASNSVQVEVGPTSTPQNANLFVEVQPKTEHPFQAEFNTTGFTFLINEDGRGNRTDGKGNTRSIDLRLDDGEFLERLIYYASYGDDLLLICESSIGDGGAGFIARLDGRTSRLKWKRHIPAFNVGQGLLHDKFAYVSGIGFVGKVNLESGVFAWKHDDLYGQKDGAFNIFEGPKINSNIIRFTEGKSYLRKTLASIDVDIETGKIVKIER